MAMWGRKEKGHAVSEEHSRADMDLSTAEGTNELIFYLVVRFVLVMLAVMVTESLTVWFESRCLVPILRGMASGLDGSLSQDTSTTVALVRWAGLLLSAIVADTGAPIADDPQMLFQPFARGDAARASSGGSGLGLSICKRVADLHGYDLTLVQPYGRFAKAFALRCTVVG